MTIQAQLGGVELRAAYGQAQLILLYRTAQVAQIEANTRDAVLHRIELLRDGLFFVSGRMQLAPARLESPVRRFNKRLFLADLLGQRYRRGRRCDSCVTT